MMGLYEGILGIQRDYKGLRIRPAFPSSWEEAEVTRHLRGADYRVRLRRGEHKGILVDGESIEGDLLPDFQDGKEHLVEVTL
jgi:cellobiose phosphorylase